MSAEINNREYRKEVLRELIEQLHQGKTVEEVKGRFAEVFGDVSAEEIALAEQSLIAGGVPVSEVQRLCDVHAAFFKGSIEEIHASKDASDIPGHPAHTLKRENKALEIQVDRVRKLIAQDSSEENTAKLEEELVKLGEFDVHYVKKENLLFPYMEKYGITAPPKVMWGVDDEIRLQYKSALSKFRKEGKEAAADEIEQALTRITEMIFKENNILLPMVLENLTQDEWKIIADESRDLGYCLIKNVVEWNPVKSYQQENIQAAEQEDIQPVSGMIQLPTGVLKVEELTHMLDLLPIDITFVDKDDTVKYFSQGAERIFPRTKAIIGRKVSNCHPPASVHIVEKLVEEFRTGKKDSEDFWIKMRGQYILIRYFAVRDNEGEYLGVLEVTQNIQPIQEITGEKRLASE